MNHFIFFLLYPFIIIALFICLFIYYCYLTEENKLILINRKNDSNINPIKGSKYSAGIDIHSNENILISSGGRRLISTGLYIGQVPVSHYLRVASIISMSVKGIDLGAGVIDRDYEGEIKVLLINSSDKEFQIKKNDIIAQLIPEKYYSNIIKIDNFIDSSSIDCQIVGDKRNNDTFVSTDGKSSMNILVKDSKDNKKLD